MTKLHLSADLTLPLEAVTQTFAILAKRGVGKTYTALVLVEELLKANLPVVVIDPIGVCWGLRASADGRSAGLPIVVLGGDHGDVPLDSTNGETIARLIVEERLSAVIDLSLMRKGEQTRFMTDFCERLYHSNREPLHLVLDEADAWAPQRPMPGQQRLLGAVEDLVRRGRARGLGITLVTQRSAVLNKDVLTQVEVLVALRTIAPQDRAAIDEWIKVHGTPAQREELMRSLPSLPVGTAWFWSPGWLDVFQRVRVRRRETFDSSATPKVGAVTKQPKKLADVDLSALRARLIATIEKAKADDPKELRRRITELERQLEHKTAPLPERIEVPVIDVAAVNALEQIVGSFKEVLRQLMERMDDIEDALAKAVFGNLQPVSRPTRHVEPPPVRPPARQLHATPPPHRIAESGFRVSATQQRILDALAFYESIGVAEPSNLQVGAIALIDATGGHFSNTVGPLSSIGLVERRAGAMRLTDAGRALASVPDNIATLADYHDMLRQRVRRARSASGRTVDMLDAIIARNGNALTTEEIGAIVGIDHTGGHFSNTIGPLSTLGLIERRQGMVFPTEILFPPTMR